MKNLILAILVLTLIGCKTTQPEPHTQEEARRKIAEYGAVWGSTNEAGETGWCSPNPIPVWDRWILDCKNATPQTTVNGVECPQ
jgi:hypothetical protein